jgi:uncharacterized protein
MVIGTADPVEGAAALDALHLLAEHLMPGRWAEVREPTRRKLAATLAQRVALAEASVKLGGPGCRHRARRRRGPVGGWWVAT